MDKQTNNPTYKQKTTRRTGRQTNKQTDRPTDRQTTLTDDCIIEFLFGKDDVVVGYGTRVKLALPHDLPVAGPALLVVALDEDVAP